MKTLIQSDDSSKAKQVKAARSSKKAEAVAPVVELAAVSASAVAVLDRHAMIEEAAYFLAEKRGFTGDYQMEDWLAAELEVDQRILAQNLKAAS